MSRRRWVPGVAFAALAAVAAAAWWWQRPIAPQASPAAVRTSTSAPGAAGGGNQPVVVEVSRVRLEPLTEDVEAVGSLRSRQGVMVRAEVGGRVTQVGFRDGQPVRKGHLLVQFDDRLPRAQVQQALAELSIAQANHKRNTELVAQGFISQRGLDESAAAMSVAQAKAELARATAARLRVLAPFDGVTGLRNVSVGDYLKEGADIVNLEDMSAVYVDFRLPERLQSRVRPGLSARVQVDALPDRAFAATVQAVDPQIDANGRSLSVRGCIDNRLQQLRPGMFAKVNMRLGDDRQAPMVPEEAIVSQGGRQSVIVLAPGDSEGSWRSRRAEVETGARRGGLVEIVRGLSPGDRIVTAGQQRIARDGMPLRLAEMVTDGVPEPTHAASTPVAASGPAPLPWAATAPGPGPCAAAR